MMSKSQPSEYPYWIPPEEYLDALWDRVYPIYAKLLVGSFVGRSPFGWSDERLKERGEPPDWGPWEMGLEPLATDLNFLFCGLESLLQEETREGNEAKKGRFDVFLGRQRQESFGLGIRIRLRDALLEVLEEVRPHEAAHAPPFRMLLEGTVRTLHNWVSWPEGPHSWCSPIHLWPDPDDTPPKDVQDRPLPERMEIASAMRERPAKDSERHRRRMSWIFPSRDPEAAAMGVPQGDTTPWNLPEIARDPDILRRALWAVVTLSELGRAEDWEEDPNEGKGREGCLPSEKARRDRVELEALGRRLFLRPTCAPSRWRREAVLSEWLHELRSIEAFTEEAERILREADLGVLGEGRDLSAKIPQPPGKAGRPGDFLGQLAVALYEFHRLEKMDRDETLQRSGKLPRRKSPDLYALERVASDLEWLFPESEEWLRRTKAGKLHAKSKLRRLVDRECH